MRNQNRTEARQIRIQQLYDHLLTLADPNTGRVAITGEMVSKEFGVTGSCGRSYIAELCGRGKLVRISEIKKGTPTLYRIPALCKGDVMTYYEETQKRLAKEKTSKDSLSGLEMSPGKIEPIPKVPIYAVGLYKERMTGKELGNRLFSISQTLGDDLRYNVELRIAELEEEEEEEPCENLISSEE